MSVRHIVRSVLSGVVGDCLPEVDAQAIADKLEEALTAQARAEQYREAMRSVHSMAQRAKDAQVKATLGQMAADLEATAERWEREGA